MRTLTRPDGSVTTYDYDSLNRLSALTTTVSGVTVSRYAYTYNQQDYRDSEDAVEAGAGLSDALANYTYNNVNQLTQISDPGARNLTYDADGNLTGGYTPEGFAFTATYDADNRLSTFSYTDAAGAVNRTEFSYIKNLLLKQRVLKNGALTQERRYVYDGLLLAQERDANNNLVNEYTYGLDLGGGIGGALALNQGGAWYSYLYDGKGNVMALLNGSGQVAQSYQYDPFGVRLNASGALNQPLQFSTKPYDEKTGLSFYGYRFYNASLGRWLTRDPIGERGGINLYGFARNNSINYIDFFGLLSPEDDEDEDENKCGPTPPDGPPSPDDLAEKAIEDALLGYRGWEWGGYLRENGKYTGPFTSESPIMTTRGPRPNDYIGDYHTHTRGKKSHEFSDDDMFSNYINEKPGYMGTQDGAIYRYDPPSFDRSRNYDFNYPNTGKKTRIK